MTHEKTIRVYATFVTPYLFGMERAVIELFEAVQPEVEAHFMMTFTTQRLNLPVLKRVKTARINYSFLSDKKDWPTPHKPRNIREMVSISAAVIRSNWDTLRASRNEDILYIPSYRAIYSVLLTILLFRLRRKPVVYAFHDTRSQPSKLLHYTRCLITNYIFHSDFSEQAFRNKNSWSATKNKKIISIITEIDITEKYHPVKKYSHAILSIGQISPHKGVDLLIDAFNEIEEEFPNATLHLLGTPSKNYETAFFHAIEELQRKNKLVYWGYQDNVHDFIKDSYVFVQPSPPSKFSEAFGRGVVEAMGHGVPSICFRSGALPEHVIDGETGLVCHEESVECLKNELRRILSDTDLRNRLAHNARKRFADHYSTEVLRTQWIKYFQDLRTNR